MDKDELCSVLDKVVKSVDSVNVRINDLEDKIDKLKDIMMLNTIEK